MKQKLSFLQEYFVRRVGREVFRSQFADWAGHNCANMDYLTREQVNWNIGDDNTDGCDNRGSLKISCVPYLVLQLIFHHHELLYYK